MPKHDDQRAFRVRNQATANSKALPALLRMAIPRRMFTRSHLDYVAEAVIYAAAHKQEIRGLRFTCEAPVLRHVTARFEWV